MKSEKILVLLDSKNNENLLNLSVSLAKNDKSTLYFMYVVEVPHKYPIEYEIGNQISLGENLSLIHISEPTRRYAIGCGGGGG